MKIDVDRILPNPHRDLKRNPIRPEQVTNILESIERNGFWDNLVVRKSPTQPGYYELAYGHHRMAAVVKHGIAVVDLPVREISDWGMYLAMVDENTTQATITPDVVFEDIGVGAHLLEKYIRESETFKEFAVNLQRLPADAVLPANVYSKIRNAVLAGEGIGRDLVQTYLPSIAVRDHNVVSAVLGSLYGEVRKATAEKKAKEAEEANRQAAAEHKAAQAEHERKVEEARKAKLEAEAAARAKHDAAKKDEETKRKAAAEKQAANERARKAQQAALAAEREVKAREKEAREARELEAERRVTAARLAKTEGVDEKILRSFSSPSVMAEFAAVVNRLNIPAKYHQAAAEKVVAEDWSRTTLRQALPAWWDQESGAAAKRLREIREAAAVWRFNKAYNDGNFNNFVSDYIRELKKLDHRTDVLRDNIIHGDTNLRHGAIKELIAFITRLQEIVDIAGRPDVVKTTDITPVTMMLTHHN